MDHAELDALVSAELPAVMVGLNRRFPGTRVTPDEVGRAAAHHRERSTALPANRTEVFAWLYGVACQRHLMAVVTDRQPVIAAQLAKQYRRAPINVEDVMQTAYVNAHRAIEASPSAAGLPLTPTAVQAWFARIARNAAIDALRRQARRRRLDGPLGDDLAATLSAPQSHPTPPNQIGACLDRLPDVERRVAELCLAGRKPAAIAQALDTPVTRIYERIRSVKDRLRRCLEPAQEDDA